MVENRTERTDRSRGTRTKRGVTNTFYVQYYWWTAADRRWRRPVTSDTGTPWWWRNSFFLSLSPCFPSPLSVPACVRMSVCFFVVFLYLAVYYSARVNSFLDQSSHGTAYA